MNTKVHNQKSKNCGSNSQPLIETKSLSGSSKKESQNIFQGQGKTTASINKPPVWFPIQKQMFENADRENHKFYVSKDYLNNEGKWVKRFRSFQTSQDYLKLNKKLPQERKNYCELIRTNQQCKPFFDIEWYGYRKDTEHHHEEIYMIIESYIIAAFEVLEIELDPNSIIVLESHRFGEKPKYSYHVIINGFHLKNLHQHGKFLAHKVVELINKDPNSPLFDCLDKDGNSKHPIDLNIYGNNQNFRLFDHHKQDENDRELKICEGRECKTEFGYLVTAMSSESKLLEFEIPKPVKNISKNSFTYNNDYLLKVLDIIDISKIKRKEWITIGVALKNEFGETGLEYFDQFSQKFECYDYEELHKDWNSFSDTYTNTAGTIIHHARETNPIEYYNLFKTTNHHLDDDDLNLSSIFYQSHSNDYVCYSIKKQVVWYKFNGSRYLKTSEEELKQTIIDHLRDIFKQQAVNLNKQIDAAQSDLNNMNSETQEYKDLERTIQNNVNCLKITKHIFKTVGKNCKRNSILGCLTHFYLNEKFPDLIDRNPYLIGFENGVYDLKEKKFRNGQRTDYITMSTGYDYTEDKTHYKEIDEFYGKLFSFSSKVKLFTVQTIARSLIGDNSSVLQNFYIWNGVGANGKSALENLVCYTAGDYAMKFDSQMLIQKSVGTHQAREDYKQLIGVRYAIASEIEDNNKREPVRLNEKTIKHFSGEKTFEFRGNYESKKTYPIMFTMFLLCNQKPEIKIEDATTRRLLYTHFKSRFIKPQEYNPNTPDTYLIDYELSNKIESWKMSHFHYLVAHLQLVFDYPQEVLEFSKESMNETDILYNIIDELFIPANDPKKGLTFKEFKQMIKDHERGKEIQFNNENKLIEMVRKRCKFIEIKDDTTITKTYYSIVKNSHSKTNGKICLNIALQSNKDSEDTQPLSYI